MKVGSLIVGPGGEVRVLELGGEGRKRSERDDDESMDSSTPLPKFAEVDLDDVLSRLEQVAESIAEQQRVVGFFRSPNRSEADRVCGVLDKEGISCAVVRRNDEWAVTLREKDVVRAELALTRAGVELAPVGGIQEQGEDDEAVRVPQSKILSGIEGLNRIFGKKESFEEPLMNDEDDLPVGEFMRMAGKDLFEREARKPPEPGERKVKEEPVWEFYLSPGVCASPEGIASLVKGVEGVKDVEVFCVVKFKGDEIKKDDVVAAFEAEELEILKVEREMGEARPSRHLIVDRKRRFD